MKSVNLNPRMSCLRFTPISPYRYLNTDTSTPISHTLILNLNTDISYLNTDISYLNTDISYLNTDISYPDPKLNSYPDPKLNSYPDPDHAQPTASNP